MITPESVAEPQERTCFFQRHAKIKVLLGCRVNESKMAVVGYVTVRISAADMLACSQKQSAGIEHDIHNSSACFHVLRYMKTKVHEN